MLTFVQINSNQCDAMTFINRRTQSWYCSTSDSLAVGMLLVQPNCGLGIRQVVKSNCGLWRLKLEYHKCRPIAYSSVDPPTHAWLWTSRYHIPSLYTETLFKILLFWTTVCIKKRANKQRVNSDTGGYIEHNKSKTLKTVLHVEGLLASIDNFFWLSIGCQNYPTLQRNKPAL